ncbi:MAG: RNA methyltransferase [Oscillospiraceae bacterium]|nr:RNA methyltransferase [Oscillospiraceae bacterium]
MERVTSRTNPLIAHARKLAASAPYSRTAGEFVCDGPKLLREALSHGVAVRTVICADGTEIPPLPSGVRTVSVPPDLMETVSPSKTPQGVLCVCATPERPLPETLSGRLYLVLDGVQDPGNVGTMLRTADAFGADGAFLLNGCAGLWRPKTIRAAMGATFRVPAWTCTAAELSALLRRSALPLYGAALRPDAKTMGDTDLSRCAVAIGSEGNGLSEEILSLCDAAFKIPMREHCESLNAAIAAAVILWEAARRRGE